MEKHKPFNGMNHDEIKSFFRNYDKIFYGMGIREIWVNLDGSRFVACDDVIFFKGYELNGLGI